MSKSQRLYSAAILVSVLLIVVYEDSQIGFTLLFALLLMLLLSWITMIFAPRRISIQQELPTRRISKGETVDYTLTLNNRSFFFYPRVEISYANTQVLRYRMGWKSALGLSSRGSLVEKSQILLPYRGIYQVGVERLVLTDALGLFRRELTDFSPRRVTVYPSYDPAYDLELLNQPERIARQKDFYNEDYSQVSDVREYQSADDLRRVHWKLSAKKGNLMVKNYETLETSRTVVFLDTRKIPLEGIPEIAFEDQLVHHVASSLYHCVEQRLTTQLVYGTQETQQVLLYQSGQLEGALEILAGVYFSGNSSAMQTLSQLAHTTFLILFLTRITVEDFQIIEYLSHYESVPWIYFFHSNQVPCSSEEEGLLAELEGRGIPVTKIQLK